MVDMRIIFKGRSILADGIPYGRGVYKPVPHSSMKVSHLILNERLGRLLWVALHYEAGRLTRTGLLGMDFEESCAGILDLVFHVVAYIHYFLVWGLLDRSS